jgi:hypothetical protein
MSAQQEFTIGEIEFRIYEKSFTINGAVCYWEDPDFAQQFKDAMSRELARAFRNGKEAARAEIKKAIFG